MVGKEFKVGKEFTVGKEFMVGKEFTIQYKKAEQSSPQIVCVSQGLEPKCVHHRVNSQKRVYGTMEKE